MGGGYWRREDFARYSAGMGRKVRADGNIDTSGMRGAQDMYRARGIDPKLDPYKVVRECCDNDEHPATVPVILALDVTGSMGGALLKTAASLNVIMQNVLDTYKDVEFMVMGIGDLAYDRAPIQISQFESDIRIAEHLDKIWFERGGGGNSFESYTAAWYMGLNHTSLDCWKSATSPSTPSCRESGSLKSPVMCSREMWRPPNSTAAHWRNLRSSTWRSTTPETATEATPRRSTRPLAASWAKD